MSLDRAGKPLLVIARDGVTADDATYPSGATQAGSIAVPADYRGSITHCLCRAVGSGAGVACRVTIFGYNTDAAQWFVLVQLNGGNVIDRLTNTPVADTNNINFAETFAHISGFDRLYPLIESTAALAAAGIDFWFLFEGP